MQDTTEYFLFFFLFLVSRKLAQTESVSNISHHAQMHSSSKGNAGGGSDRIEFTLDKTASFSRSPLSSPSSNLISHKYKL